MLEQAVDLRDEGDELYDLLKRLAPEDWAKPTPFKSWTVNDVVNHLHSSDWMAVQSLERGDGFHDLVKAVRDGTAADYPEPLEGATLLARWREYFLHMCDLLGNSDPKLRLKWFGPDMGVRMFTTARLMETWAHGHDVYDLLGKPRVYTDRIKNIAEIGVRTFGWTFVNRGLEVPPDIPYVRLTAPSGALWEWNTPSETNKVEGSAIEFCHVVTQGRNVVDTELTVVGDTANRWMSIAQCFAGGPEDPPAPGTRV